MQPKVTLLTAPVDWRRTIWNIWWSSKNEKTLQQIQREYDPTEFTKLFSKLLQMDVPILENVNFVFLLENVSVSFREQMVRHRIGTHVGERVGVDIVPDLADSSWWSQSMRIMSMGAFYDKGNYIIPESIQSNVNTREVYKNAMFTIQSAYEKLRQLGVPMQDARELIPLGATHRITWSMNLMALKHIIGKRSCWILQGGYWQPIIEGMIDELAKYDQLFGHLANPPCVRLNGEGKQEWKGCQFKHENERRETREDDMPLCPLYLREKYKGHGDEIRQAFQENYDNAIDPDREDQYKAFWNFDEGVVNYESVSE